MTNEFLEMKKIVIDDLLNRIADEDKKDLAKEFNLTEEQLNTLIKKMLDKWLNNPDFILMLATVLGLSMPRKGKERKAHYIG